MSDSELITLAVAQVLQGYHCERRWVRHIRSSAELAGHVPYLPQQSGYHKRLKDAQPLLCKAILTLAACCPSWFDDINHHLIRTGQILLADKGFLRQTVQQLTASMRLQLLRPDRKDETYTNSHLRGVRQWIESVNQTLKAQLDLETQGGRTPAGVFTRVAQRLLALAAGIWHNWTTGATSKRSLIRLDH